MNFIHDDVNDDFNYDVGHGICDMNHVKSIQKNFNRINKASNFNNTQLIDIIYTNNI